MNKGDSELPETDDEMLQNSRNVYEILRAWAASGSQLIYSTGPYGFDVEGTLRQIREPEDESWGILDASFIFSSKTREITACVFLMPRMKILTKPSGEVRAVEFGPQGAGRCTLRSRERRVPNPEDVKNVLAQLRTWSERKMNVWVHLDHGFSALASFCKVEEVNDQCFALTEEGSSQTFFAIPALGSRASIEDLEGLTTVRLISEDRRSELRIFEPGTERSNLMDRMITKMVQ
jgi:hypothetical protein